MARAGTTSAAVGFGIPMHTRSEVVHHMHTPMTGPHSGKGPCGGGGGGGGEGKGGLICM